MSYAGDDHVDIYLAETIAIAKGIDREAIEALVEALERQRNNDWRVFVLGLGGSLANATHLAADLRQRAACRAEAPESLPELTALANDCGWGDMLTRWLVLRDLETDDLVLVLSVGGGGQPHTMTSWPLVEALNYAKSRHAGTAAIVGEPGGHAAEIADVVVKIPTVNPARKTEHCEGWQGIIHHLLVGHPRLRRT